MTGPRGQARITPKPSKISAGAAAEKQNGSAKVSVKKRRVSAGNKSKRSKTAKLAETIPGLQVNVDDATLCKLILSGKIGIHRNGSRQKKNGTYYDYRSHYRALRLNSGGREVLAFGTPERLTEKLAQLGVYICFDHARPMLSVGDACQHCRAGKGEAKRAGL